MTPPPAVAVADMMRPLPTTADSQINRDILSVMDRPTLPYWLLLGFLVVFVHAAGAVWVYQVYKGLGIAGYSHPIFWGVYIVTFVF